MTATCRRHLDPPGPTLWVELGTVTTDTATFAILDPGASAALARQWVDVVTNICSATYADTPGDLSVFEEVELHQGDGHPYVEPNPVEKAFVVRTDCDGGYRVLGRFADPYGDGQLRVAELRLVLIEPDDDED